MSPTLLEIVVAIVLVVALWQIGVMIAPGILAWLRQTGRDIDAAADRALDVENRDKDSVKTSKEHFDDTHGKS